MAGTRAPKRRATSKIADEVRGVSTPPLEGAELLPTRRSVKFGERDSNPGTTSHNAAKRADRGDEYPLEEGGESASEQVATSGVTAPVTTPDRAMKAAVVAALDAGDHELAAEILALMRRRGPPPEAVVDLDAARRARGQR